MRLRHKTQRGGEIRHLGPPVPPGEEAILKVDERGYFEAPEELGRCLMRVLAPNVIQATVVRTNRRDEDAGR